MNACSNHRFAAAAALAASLAGSTSAATATIDVKIRRQKISGFGTCSAWNGTLTAAEGEQLWSVAKGAGLSLHRIMIERDGSPDPNEKKNAKLATGYGVKVWGTPWYSKYAVKVANKDYDTLAERDMQAWADALAASAKAMEAAGTPLYAISPQNESDLGWVKYDAKAMALWVGKYLGPTMAAQAPEVKVMGSEACNWYGLGGYEPVLMSDPAVTKYASIIATHLYGGTMKAYPDIQQAGKEFWQTEIYDSKTDVEDTGIVSGLRIAQMIHEGLTVANFNAWHFWWIKPCSKCANGALWAEATNRPTKRLWVMGNWSKFVRPGFVRVDAPASSASGVSLTAFRDSALTKVVIVAVNSGMADVSQGFSIPGAMPSALTAHVTDKTRDIALQETRILSSSSFAHSLPAQSVTTLVVDVGPRTSGVRNGAFENGSDGWTFNVWGGGASGSVSNGEYKIAIDSVGEGNSAIQLVQNGILLEQGKSYKVSFDAHALSNLTLEANVEQDTSPWTSYLPAARSFDLTTTRAGYSYTFTMANPTDSNSRIAFNAGASTGTVFLDDISVKVKDPISVRGRGAWSGAIAGASVDHGTLRVDYVALEGKQVAINLFDPKGARVMERSFLAGSGGRNVWSTSLAGLGDGVYVVGIRVAGKDAGRIVIVNRNWKERKP